MKQSTKYLKILCNFLAAGMLLFVLFFVLPRLLVYFMPFVIGMIFAMIANPLVRFLEKKIKIKRKYGSVLMIALVIGLLVLVCYGVGSALATGIREFMAYLPTMSANAGLELTEAIHQLQNLLDKTPFFQNVDLMGMADAVQEYLAKAVSGTDGSNISAIGDFAKSIPDILVSVVVGLMATYFFIADKDKLITIMENHISDSFLGKLKHIYGQLVHVVGGYFKAQFKIMGVIYIVLLIGLTILQIKYAWLIAFGIAFLDMLPVFGTGTILCPWAVIKLLSGDFALAFGMICLYLIALVVHQLVQPKLIGDSVGMDPFVALFLMFIGYKVSGVLGMILAIPIGMILINLYRAGTFDTFVWCIKEVGHDFNEFRKIDSTK